MTFDHAKLETGGRHVVSLLQCEGQEVACQAWRSFLEELLLHLDAEECSMLPAFDRVKPEACASIRSDHARIRRAAEVVTRSFERRSPDEWALRDLLHLLALHGRMEENDLYPWSETGVGEHESRAVIERIEKSEARMA
jgi:hypothetical protein